MEEEKNNPVLIIVIIIIVLLLGGFIFKVAILDTNALDMKTESQLIVEKRKSEITKREREKNKVTTDNTLEVGEAHPTDSRLEKIANIYNNSSYVADLKTKGYLVNAQAVGNKITIYINGSGTVLDVPFELDSSNLNTTIIRHSAEEIKTAEDLVVFPLIDCIGIYKELEKNTLYSILSKEKSLSKYNVEEHGFEIDSLEDENKINVKVNLDNDFSYFKK